MSPVAEDPALRRDAVDDLVVDRDADAAREDPAVDLVALERRHGAAAARHLLGDPIELGGGHPGRDARAQLGQHLGHDDVGGAHDLDLVA